MSSCGTTSSIIRHAACLSSRGRLDFGAKALISSLSIHRQAHFVPKIVQVCIKGYQTIKANIKRIFGFVQRTLTFFVVDRMPSFVFSSEGWEAIRSTHRGEARQPPRRRQKRRKNTRKTPYFRSKTHFLFALERSNWVKTPPPRRRNAPMLLEFRKSAWNSPMTRSKTHFMLRIYAQFFVTPADSLPR